MIRFYGLLGAVALAVLLASFAGCGDTIIDTAKTEEALQASLSKSLEEKVSSVDCPSEQKVEKGATFTCSVKLSDGEERTATLKIRNEQADVNVIHLSATSQQDQ